MNGIHWDIDRLLRNELPDVELREVEAERGASEMLEVLYQGLLIGSSLGAFGGLWRVFQLFVQRYAGCTITVSYVATDGSQVEINYHNRTAAEADVIAKRFPRKLTNPIIIKVHRSSR